MIEEENLYEAEISAKAKEENTTFPIEPIVEKKEPPLIKYLKYKGNFARVVAFVSLIIITTVLTIGLAYYTFFNFIPYIWIWGTDPVSFKIIFAIIILFFIWILPFLPIIFLGPYVSNILSLFANNVEKEFKENLANIEKQQIHYKDILDESDAEKLIPLITHSRIELEQYYSIALHQTTKSFRYSIGAMTIGLIIIFLGMFSYIFPNDFLNNEVRNGNFQPLVITSGIVLELISVIFLSIYKTSLGRLTYFYDRQVFIHNAMFAFKISKTMEEQDVSKKLIVEKILDFGSKSNSDYKKIKIG
ncbi:TRADD-N-associated membrane domain-containing protein [Psychrobacter immobilis]|uniref:TRADD-N-associated membrane domain-containing protein n=1 Tax=Psychrobacter immobilis TaxID=498 RepID=UPI001917DA80|nr:hypothetical protein [Psychrobacter immobilis]